MPSANLKFVTGIITAVTCRCNIFPGGSTDWKINTKLRGAQPTIVLIRTLLQCNYTAMHLDDRTGHIQAQPGARQGDTVTAAGIFTENRFLFARRYPGALIGDSQADAAAGHAPC